MLSTPKHNPSMTAAPPASRLLASLSLTAHMAVDRRPFPVCARGRPSQAVIGMRGSEDCLNPCSVLRTGPPACSKPMRWHLVASTGLSDQHYPVARGPGGRHEPGKKIDWSMAGDDRGVRVVSIVVLLIYPWISQRRIDLVCVREVMVAMGPGWMGAQSDQSPGLQRAPGKLATGAGRSRNVPFTGGPSVMVACCEDSSLANAQSPSDMSPTASGASHLVKGTPHPQP